MSITHEELSKLKVTDLKARLTTFGLSTQGLKNELVDRLYEHLQPDGDDVGPKDMDEEKEDGEENNGEEQEGNEDDDGGGMGLPPDEEDEQQSADMVTEEDDERDTQSQSLSELISKAREQEEVCFKYKILFILFSLAHLQIKITVVAAATDLDLDVKHIEVNSLESSAFEKLELSSY
ncbi:uncharacterized protein LOC135218266 [Macrobrachium nipponense]|uniref:uncharacterized protein LOC135218266 n=1 Tax=Macrobrachium nipponense TaxID=159736 RepID=UPI0030C7E7B8